MSWRQFRVRRNSGIRRLAQRGNSDLSSNVAEGSVHIASIGIEKIVRAPGALGCSVLLLSCAGALGSPITPDPPFPRTSDCGEMHVVLVDNGRSDRLGLRSSGASCLGMHAVGGACMKASLSVSIGGSGGSDYRRHLLQVVLSDRPHHRSDLQAREIQQPAFASSLQRRLQGQSAPVRFNSTRGRSMLGRRVLVKGSHEVPLAKSPNECLLVCCCSQCLRRLRAFRDRHRSDTALAPPSALRLYNGLNASGGSTARCPIPQQTSPRLVSREPWSSKREHPATSILPLSRGPSYHRLGLAAAGLTSATV